MDTDNSGADHVLGTTSQQMEDAVANVPNSSGQADVSDTTS